MIFFIFFLISTFGRVTLSRSSFIQQKFFCKRKQLFFYHFQHCIFLTTPFILDMSVFFFANFHSTLKNIFSIFQFFQFFKKMNTTLIFSIFRLLFKIKHHPILRKKQNEKLFFCIFFQKFKTHFFVLTRVKFFEF